MVPVVLGHLSKTTDTFRYSLWPSVVSGDSSHFGTISNICLNFSSNQQEAVVSHCFADISQNSWLSSCCEVNYSGAEQTHSAESSSSFIHAGEPGRGGDLKSIGQKNWNSVRWRTDHVHGKFRGKIFSWHLQEPQAEPLHQSLRLHPQG